eukprot:2047122-Amphidinium_carterae.2
MFVVRPTSLAPRYIALALARRMCTKLSTQQAHYMGTYGPTANFRSFFGAISLLIRSMTGEAWNEIMHDLAKDRSCSGCEAHYTVETKSLQAIFRFLRIT